MLTVLTRPALINPHIVVLPKPESLQAFFTVTQSGFAVSDEFAVLQILIALQFLLISSVRVCTPRFVAT
jgi:hypothetical protein